MKRTTNLILATMLMSQTVLAASKDIKFCNETEYAATGLIVKTRSPILNYKFKEGIFKNEGELAEGSRELKVTGSDLAASDCINGKLDSGALDPNVKSYQWLYRQGDQLVKSKKHFVKNNDLDSTAILTDLNQVINDSVRDEASVASAQRDLDNCSSATECASAQVTLVEAQAQAQANRKTIKEKLEQAKGIITSGGKYLLPLLGGFAIGKLDYVAKLFTKKKELESCLSSGADCIPLQSEIRDIETEIENIEGNFQEHWTELTDNHIADRQYDESQPIEVEVSLPGYFDGKVPVGNESPKVVAAIGTEELRHIKKINLNVEGKLYPVQFDTKRGLIQSELKDLKPHGVFEGAIVVETVDGKKTKKPFGLKKDSTKPEVKINQRGKKFFVTIKDQGLGFDGYEVSGSNIVLDNPKVEFNSKRKEVEFVVKMKKKPASINVKAIKKVLEQKVENFGNENSAISLGLDGFIQFPENTFNPLELTGLSIEEILERMVRVNGYCCRYDCWGCIGPKSLRYCRNLGYGFFKFKKDDNVCYYIKPLP